MQTESPPSLCRLHEPPGHERPLPAEPRRPRAHPALRRRREDAAERPQGHRRADRLPEHRLAPDPGADGVAQRGRARQVGLRPLLRAHDVPRHEGLPARRLPGDPHEGRRAAERLHDRRLHELPHDLRQGGPRDDPEGRGRPLPEPRVLRSRPSRPSRARCSASTTRTAPTRSRSSSRSSARRAFKVHTYRHTTMGFLKDIEDMPNQFEYSKTFFDRWYRPEYTTVIVAGDVKADEVLPLVEKYWGAWKRGHLQGRDPGRAAAAGPGERARPLERADPALGERRLPRARPSPRRAASGRRLDILSDLDVRPDLGALQEARRGGAEGRPALRRRARRTSTRSSSPCSRA